MKYADQALVSWVQFDVDRHGTSQEVQDRYLAQIHFLQSHLEGIWTTSPGNYYDGQLVLGRYLWVRLKKPMQVLVIRERIKRWLASHGQDIDFGFADRSDNVRLPGQFNVEVLTDPLDDCSYISRGDVESGGGEDPLGVFLKQWEKVEPISISVFNVKKGVHSGQTYKRTKKTTQAAAAASVSLQKKSRIRPAHESHYRTISRRGEGQKRVCDRSRKRPVCGVRRMEGLATPSQVFKPRDLLQALGTAVLSEPNTFRAAHPVLSHLTRKHRGRNFDTALQEFEEIFPSLRPADSYTCSDPDRLHRFAERNLRHFYDTFKETVTWRKIPPAIHSASLPHCLRLDRKDFDCWVGAQPWSDWRKAKTSKAFEVLQKQKGRIAARNRSNIPNHEGWVWYRDPGEHKQIFTDYDEFKVWRDFMRSEGLFVCTRDADDEKRHCRAFTFTMKCVEVVVSYRSQFTVTTEPNCLSTPVDQPEHHREFVRDLVQHCVDAAKRDHWLRLAG